MSEVNFRKIEVTECTKIEMKHILYDNHYLKYLPQLNKEFLGGYIENELVAGMSLGWGVRPRHTIQKLFPSLSTEDYRCLGRLCLEEKMPRNSESFFISSCIEYIKEEWPTLKVLFSWSDGILGKPGYVYQASNFYYGGYIWTDTYLTNKGERVHPRQTNRIGGRPSFKELEELGWKHFRGKQFRYVFFLCDRRERRRLREESTINWRHQEGYPKHGDLEWKVRTEDGWKRCGEPFYDPERYVYNEEKGRELKAYREQESLTNFTEGPG